MCIRDRCEKCGQIVAKAEYEQHIQDKHTLVRCADCGQEMEKSELENHPAVCLKKPRMCQYCGLQFKRDLYDEHIANCSTRTDKCERCKKNITKRDMEHHLMTCQGSEAYHESFPSLSQTGNSSTYTSSLRVSKPDQVPPARREMIDPQFSDYSSYAKSQTITNMRPQPAMNAANTRPSDFDRSRVQSNIAASGASNAMPSSQIARDVRPPPPATFVSARESAMRETRISAPAKNNLGVSIKESIYQPGDGDSYLGRDSVQS
eukprot:TRINITY_DN7651_c0_g1_i5.p1 TRINITY_DN7651_c0_g1~~TRINITY_DN7651_c0_g1_i5.p1  ORF type:complete len:304 (-),score=34.87 TRINITY_DN7651_c0_g1_i5:784-1569(-)